MTILNTISNLKINQRKIVAIVLAIVLTGSHVPAAQADEALPQTDATIFSLTVPQTEATLAPVAEPTVQEVLLDVCKSNGYGEDCAKTLLGMLWNESSNRSTVIGDHGLARGYFQIHYKMHGISTDCAEDLVCSANWTLNYMEAHSYPKYVTYAVQCHNSCGVNNGYAAKALRNAKRMWNVPLAVEQAKPIELASK